jgi:hypothetical protein
MTSLGAIIPSRCKCGSCEGQAVRYAPFIAPYAIVGWCEKHAPRVWITKEELTRKVIIYTIMKS